MIRRTLIAIAVLIVALLAPRAEPVSAHPHVWVTASAVLQFDAKQRVESITVRYALDELTTAVLIEGLDENGNGIYDREELKATAAGNAESLAEFDYFVEVQAAGERIATPEVLAYDYMYDEAQMVLILELALDRAVDPAAEDMSVLLYDPTFYVLVELTEDAPLLVSGVAADYCSVAVKPPSESSDGVSISDAMLQSFETNYSIGRDYADEISLACGGTG